MFHWHWDQMSSSESQPRKIELICAFKKRDYHKVYTILLSHLSDPVMAIKCSNPDHNTPWRVLLKGTSRKRKLIYLKSTVWYVCGNKITETNKEEGITCDDAIFCEGKCSAWIHRTCTGLSKQSYVALSESESPYLCPHCMQTGEGNWRFKQLVKSLVEDLFAAKTKY